MSIGLGHVDMTRWARMGLGFPARSERASVRWGGPLSLVLPVVLMVGAAGVWLVWPASDSDGADGEPVAQFTNAAFSHHRRPRTPTLFNPIRLRRRNRRATAGGDVRTTGRGRIANLGAILAAGRAQMNAQATFTLRNDNAYAVKDIEIACAFARPTAVT